MSLSGVITRQLASKGRPMVLRRRVGTTNVHLQADVVGREVAFQTQEIVGEVRMGDQRVKLAPTFSGADAVAIGAPEANDMLVIDGAAWRVMGALPHKLGTELAGWNLWVRGGK